MKGRRVLREECVGQGWIYKVEMKEGKEITGTGRNDVGRKKREERSEEEKRRMERETGERIEELRKQ